MRRVCTSIGIVWILSAIISIPPLIGWNDWPDEFTKETPCKLSEEKSYLIYSSCGSFYIPLLIMTVVYFKIFQATRKRLKDRAKASAMANLGNSKSGALKSTVSTDVHMVTKISSNDDSSSSESPKASRKFTQIKARCVKCCFSQSRSSTNEKFTANSLTGKNRHGKFSKKCKEARIEVESASDDRDHSRNEISSSDACGVTSNINNLRSDISTENLTSVQQQLQEESDRIVIRETEMKPENNGIANVHDNQVDLQLPAYSSTNIVNVENNANRDSACDTPTAQPGKILLESDLDCVCPFDNQINANNDHCDDVKVRGGKIAKNS